MSTQQRLKLEREAGRVSVLRTAMWKLFLAWMAAEEGGEAAGRVLDLFLEADLLFELSLLALPSGGERDERSGSLELTDARLLHDLVRSLASHSLLTALRFAEDAYRDTLLCLVAADMRSEAVAIHRRARRRVMRVTEGSYNPSAS